MPGFSGRTSEVRGAFGVGSVRIRYKPRKKRPFPIGPILFLFGISVLIFKFFWNDQEARDFTIIPTLKDIFSLVTSLRIWIFYPILLKDYSQHSLLYQEGVLHAKNRFVQMDFLRNLAVGNTSVIFGSKFSSLDRAYRSFDLLNLAMMDCSAMNTEERDQLGEYINGVNFVLDNSYLPLEYFSLKGIRWSYVPKKWTCSDTMSIFRLMNLQMEHGWQEDLVDLELKNQDYQLNNLFRVPSQIDWVHWVSSVSSSALLVHGNYSNQGALFFNELLGPKISSTSQIWYHVQLFSRSPSSSQMDSMASKTTSPVQTIVGMSFPGVPYVFSGHNGRIAFGFTLSSQPSTKLVIEQFEKEDDVERHTYSQGFVNCSWNNNCTNRYRIPNIHLHSEHPVDVSHDYSWEESICRLEEFLDRKNGQSVQSVHEVYCQTSQSSQILLNKVLNTWEYVEKRSEETVRSKDEKDKCSSSIVPVWTAINARQSQSFSLQALRGLNEASNWMEFSYWAKEFTSHSWHWFYADSGKGDIGAVLWPPNRTASSMAQELSQAKTVVWNPPEGMIVSGDVVWQRLWDQLAVGNSTSLSPVSMLLKPWIDGNQSGKLLTKETVLEMLKSTYSSDGMVLRGLILNALSLVEHDVDLNGSSSKSVNNDIEKENRIVVHDILDILHPFEGKYELDEEAPVFLEKFRWILLQRFFDNKKGLLGRLNQFSRKEIQIYNHHPIYDLHWIVEAIVHEDHKTLFHTPTSRQEFIKNCAVEALKDCLAEIGPRPWKWGRVHASRPESILETSYFFTNIFSAGPDIASGGEDSFLRNPTIKLSSFSGSHSLFRTFLHSGNMFESYEMV